ncbi:disabled homolog 2-interacting protein-like isoform X3 [Bolinopsis microptera]|uniref:disabled homolog 2-interacting protein-like isoform X3 n=1 Tax=Bolinopsis microptera TaxID=2820187 RepID=UPI0030797C75
MELDARLEGWLYIAFELGSGYPPSSLVWHRRYCVLEPNLKKFYVLKDEQSAQSVSNSAVVRLDDDCKNDTDTREEVFDKPLDEVFDAGTTLTQITQYRISKRIKSSGVRLSTRNTSINNSINGGRCMRMRSHEKAVSVLGIHRSQSLILLNRSASEKAVNILGIDRTMSCIDESPVTEKAGAILGINRAQSVQINGTDNKSEHTDPHHNQANPMVWTVYLGSDSPPLIRVVHQSLSGREHTFCVETKKRSFYLACRSDLELNRWIDSLQHVVDPMKEERVQLDQSLTVWIVEAKHLPKKRYFVELYLDNMFCCRTVTKPVKEMLFWGENFKFWDLRQFQKLKIVLRRENKNKKACVIGETEIHVKDLTLGLEHEHWYNLSNLTQKQTGHHVKEPQIRLKLKLQILTILPLNFYESLLTFLASKSIDLCKVLEPHLNVRQKEDLANLLLHVLHDFQKARDFLEEIVMLDVEKTEDPSLLFRGNSIATKAVDLYMKLIGSKYLKNTLGLFIRDVYDNAQEFEIDTTRIVAGEDFVTNQQNMRMKVDKAWALILSSYPKFPPDLRELFSRIRRRCDNSGRSDLSKKLLSGSIFLRFFCPAIMSPSLFNLTDEYPDERISRCLIITAKVIQNLANFTKFGGKEEYMSFMNEFVETATPNMELFLSKISEPMETEFKTAEIYNSNIGHNLASLHSFLTEKIGLLSPEDRLRLETLPTILLELDERCENLPENSQFPLPEHHSVSVGGGGAESPVEDRRRKAGSLPAVSLSDSQRQDLKMRSFQNFRSEKCTEVYGYSSNTPSNSSPEVEQEGAPHRKDIQSVVDNSEATRRRSLPAVPEENTPIAIGLFPPGNQNLFRRFQHLIFSRQMSDPTSYMGVRRQKTEVPGAAPTEPQDPDNQLNLAMDKLGNLRRAIGTFLFTHTGRSPKSDDEVLEMLEALTVALKE